MPFKIVRNDITKMKVDVIVNTANQSPIYSTGVDAAVYKGAGVDELLQARREIGFLDEGEAAITPGFHLPAKYIIHAISPLYIDGTYGEAELLYSCYEKSLHLALEHHCESIAFPLIATGNFGYPKDEGMEIALNVIHNFLMKEDMMIYLVVFDNETVRLSGKLYNEIEAFIDQNYVEEQQKIEYEDAWAEDTSVVLRESRCKEDNTKFNIEPQIMASMQAPVKSVRPMMAQSAPVPNVPVKAAISQDMMVPDFLKKESSKRALEDVINNLGETFQQRLFRLIDERGRTDVEVYKGAGKDKKLFHKIRSNENYQPTKHTVFAFAISLELSLDETKDLLASAGFAFSPSSRFDRLMLYVFENEIYNIQTIDCYIFDFGMNQFFCCEK